MSRPHNTRTPAPCGTWTARRRHARNNQTCETCHAAKAPKTVPAKPAPRQLKPCGTNAAYQRHRRRNEHCETCLTAQRDRDQANRRAKGIPPRLTNAEFISELEFLISCGEGEQRILKALGYENRLHALHQRLYRTNRHDLAQQIFGWDLAA